MSTFYFSGIEKAATAQVLGIARAAGMMSRLQYSDNLMTICNTLNLQMVMDCGSFTKPMTATEIEKYAELIIKLGNRFDWYASPDKIGNQEESNKNYAFLLSLLPEHLHERILWIYQYGSDIRHLYEGLETQKRIGIGGLVPLIQDDRNKALHTIIALAYTIREHNVLAHFFGLSTASIIQALNDILPEYTVDSTTWLMAARYGKLINRHGRQCSINDLGFTFDLEHMLIQNIKTMQGWMEHKENKKVHHVQASLFA